MEKGIGLERKSYLNFSSENPAGLLRPAPVRFLLRQNATRFSFGSIDLGPRMKAGVWISTTGPKNVEEIHAAFDQSVREVEEYLKGMTEQTAQGNWRLMLREKELFSKPRIGVLRSIMLNHWYHHRGQLSFTSDCRISLFR